MKIIYSNEISPFGGLNFVIEQLDKQGVHSIISKNFPELAQQSKYSWREIIYSFWSIYFCGGDCIEDLGQNLRSSLLTSPMMSTPSPDRILGRFKELVELKELVGTDRSETLHEFCFNRKLSDFNMDICKQLNLIPKDDVILDFDHTTLSTSKADAKMNYKKYRSYNPGVGMIGETIVFVENRNGNTSAQILQSHTFGEMFNTIERANVKIDVLRVDSASFNYEALKIAQKHVKYIFTRPRMNHGLAKDLARITDWKEISNEVDKAFRGETRFTPFVRTASRKHETDSLQEYRLIVTKTPKKSGQTDLFTKDAFQYSMIMTNNMEMGIEEVVHFYNQRGASEKQFDILKNDFGWNCMPFSKMEENTVFLILTAVCRNIYQYIITYFSERCDFLKPIFRIKKFTFRFIAIPAKWVRKGRAWVLRIYGEVAFKT